MTATTAVEPLSDVDTDGHLAAPAVSIDTKDQLIRELIRACKKLGAKSDLLGTICSYGETLDDDFILQELRRWNSLVPAA